MPLKSELIFKKFKSFLSEQIKDPKSRKSLRDNFNHIVNYPKYLINPWKKFHIYRAKDLKIYLGCGNIKMEGFINIDLRPTYSTDVVADCSKLNFIRDNSVDLCITSAFFEHLFRDDRIPHLQEVNRKISKKGIAFYYGFPYFREIAKAYLDNKDGATRDKFDLYEVYRYTHGGPEEFPSYLAQLHKSLFDIQELTYILNESNFKSYKIFNYCFKGEDHLPINLGFTASKSEIDNFKLEEITFKNVNNYAANHIIIDSLKFLN